MFFKISDNPERYVNTDNIETLSFASNGKSVALKCEIVFHSGRPLVVSENAGRALLEFAEANDSVLEDYTPEEAAAGFKQQASAPLPLTSRIAQRLRDSAPQGMMVMDLVLEYPGPEGELIIALDALVAERVIVTHGTPLRYYHVTNAPGRKP